MGNSICEIIKQYCFDNRIPISVLVERTKYQTESMHRLLKRDDIPISKLMLISKALNHNFFQYLYGGKSIPTQGELAEMRNEISQLKAQINLLTHENALLQKLIMKQA